MQLIALKRSLARWLTRAAFEIPEAFCSLALCADSHSLHQAVLRVKLPHVSKYWLQQWKRTVREGYKLLSIQSALSSSTVGDNLLLVYIASKICNVSYMGYNYEMFSSCFNSNWIWEIFNIRWFSKTCHVEVFPPRSCCLLFLSTFVMNKQSSLCLLSTFC